MVVRLLPVLQGLIAVLLVACLAQDEAPATAPDSPSDDIGLSLAPVVGGKPTDACDWPSTVDVNGCTGTLIHPRVVTSAAHCMTGSSGKVTFTSGKGGTGSFSLTGKCKAGAVGSSGGGTGRDWAYCVIPEDPRVKALPITPPLVGCEADRFLKPGATGWVVGFGTTGSNKNDDGVKREVEVKVNKVGNGIIDIGDKNVGACHGDSGGPIYMKLTDGTHDWGYRVFGSTSSASGNCDCTCSTIYVNIAQHVKAIEQNENIDVTPCTDADGKWAPSADCKEFQSDPQNASGTYPMCTVAVTHDPIATCGDAVGPVAGSGGARSTAGSGTVAGASGAAAGSGGLAGTGAVAGGTALAGTGGSAGAGLAGAGGGYVGQAGTGGTGVVGVGTFPSAGNAASSGLAGAAAGRSTAGAGLAGSTGKAGATPPLAGTPGTNFGPTQTAAPAPKSSGCQVASRIGADTHPMPWLFATLVACASLSRRQRRRAAPQRTASTA